MFRVQSIFLVQAKGNPPVCSFRRIHGWITGWYLPFFFQIFRAGHEKEAKENVPLSLVREKTFEDVLKPNRKYYPLTIDGNSTQPQNSFSHRHQGALNEAVKLLKYDCILFHSKSIHRIFLPAGCSIHDPGINQASQPLFFFVW